MEAEEQKSIKAVMAFGEHSSFPTIRSGPTGSAKLCPSIEPLPGVLKPQRSLPGHVLGDVPKERRQGSPRAGQDSSDAASGSVC
jgi:hypothetical protein